MFSDAESAGADTTAGTYSQGYEASVNTRGLVFIESSDPAIGMVCVIPIGITEISSVSFSVKQGDKVEKGNELGFNAPASRLKKSCRGVKSSLRSWSSHPVSVFGVCRWKRSELSGRGLNGKAAWVRLAGQI